MKKLITSILVVSVLFWAAGLAVLGVMPVRAAAAGDLIKMDGNPAVYYLGSDDKRYVFPNAKAYFTWYSDFSGVVTISQSELESYSIGGNVTYRAGTRMVKITTDPKTYAVEPGGVLRHVTTEAIATSLYGAEWWNLIDDVPDPFWVNYTTGSDIADATYPDGALVIEDGGTTVYYIDDGTKRPIADETAFNANNLNWDYLVTASDLSGYSDGSSLTAYEQDIATVAGPGTPAPVTSEGTLTVSLASDTPASTTVVKNATLVKFTKVNFTASGGDVTVDSVTIERTGLSQDSNFSSVYLLNTDNTIFDNEKTLGSTHKAVVNKDFTVSNGTTKTLFIGATMHSTLQAGELGTLGISAVSVGGSATVSGTLPIEGNAMTMNNTITVGTVTQAAGASNPSAATKPVGTTDYTFAAMKLTINSTEDVQIEKVRLYQAGTASDSDLGNLDLVLEGTVLATVSSLSSRYADYDLSDSPLTITKGQNKTLEIQGDILDGSSRTIYFNIDKKTDLLALGKTYGYYIDPTYQNTSSPYMDNSSSGNDAVTTVSTGTMNISKATIDSTNVAEGNTQEELGAFSFNVLGEEISVTSLPINIDITPSGSAVYTDITNLTIYDEDDLVVGGPLDPVALDGGAVDGAATITDTIIFPTGIHTYTVKGDLSTDFAADDTIKLQIDTPADITAKGETTANTVTPAPSSVIDGVTVTIKVGDLNISTSSSPAAQTVAAGTIDYVFANFVLDATQSGEDVKVTQLLIRHTTSPISLHSYINDIVLYDSAAPTEPLNTPVSGSSDTADSTYASQGTTTITLLDPLIITKGLAKTLTLKADISGSAANNSQHVFSLVGDTTTGCATVYGNSTGNSIDEDITNSDGQIMTITSAGTVQMAKAGSNPAIGLVVGDTTSEIGVFNFKALYESIDIEKVGLTISGSSNAYKNIDWLELYDGSTKMGEIQVTGANATITPASLIIGQNVTKALTLKAVAHKVGELESGTSGQNFAVKVSGLEAKGSSTGSSSVTKSGLDTTTSNSQYIYKTKPTITKVNLSGMANGTQDLYKFSLAADSKGDVGFFKATFAVTTSSATITNYKLYEVVGSSETDLTVTAPTVWDTLTANTNNAGGKYAINITFDTDGTAGELVEELRTIGAGSTKSYLLRGDVTGWDANASIQIQLMADQSAPSAVDRAEAIDAIANDNFIWSDLFLGYTSTTATAANEWTNSYKVFATTTQSF